jgi:putative addiction module component (TIGR02574 family)
MMECTMPSTFADLEYQALLLSPEDRVQLADRLLASLSSNPSVEQEWSAESLRRLAELEAGTDAGVSVESAIARAKAAIR